MDAVFQLDQAARTSFLQLFMQSTGSTYICLWSYSFMHQTSCLISWDGCCNDEITQQGALGLFLEYRQLVIPLENNNSLVPGFAFRNYMPCIELGEPELQNRASHLIQRQFYREAGIQVCSICRQSLWPLTLYSEAGLVSFLIFKKAVFMGCRSGEIELGSPNVANLNVEMEIRSFFPQDIPRQISSALPIAQPTDPNKPSSSSSSLRSLSTSGSPDSYPLIPIPIASRSQVPTFETTPSSPQPITTTSSIYDQHQQAMQQALSQLRSNIFLPTLESENAAMTKAILAVLTSPSSSSSSTSHHNSLHNHQLNPKATAFKRYAASGLSATMSTRASSRAPQSMLKRAVLFYRNLITARRAQQPRNLHHMLSERKRREKINESFDALRSLLPQGTKKDRVSILTSAREYLNSLKAQITELNRQNQSLEARLSTTSSEAADEISDSSNERFTVRIIHVPESTSQQRVVDLRVTVRGEKSILDILIQLLEFLKLDGNISLMSTDANTRISESGPINHVDLRFTIEGDDWDESTFHEAVRRLLADLAQ